MKRTFLSIAFFFLLAVPAFPSVLVQSPNGVSVSKPDMATAVASPDTAGKTIVVTTPQSLANDLTIPATIQLRCELGGIITVASGKTLTVALPLIAGKYQIFAGSGSVALNGTAYLQWWGAKGDNTNDDTAAINKAAASFASKGALQAEGIFKITGNINLPKTVDLIGVSAQVSQFNGPVGFAYVNVTGNSTLNQLHNIRHIRFSKVGVKYGATGTDYGVGGLIDACEIDGGGTSGFGVGGMPIGVEYTHNSWNTTISRSRISGCSGAAVQYSMGTAGSNAGSTMMVVSSVIFDSTIGIYVNGVTTDGTSMMFEHTNIEHCDTGIKTTGGGDGLITVTDCHFELNRVYHIDSAGALMQVTDPWMWDNGSYTGLIHFNIAGDRDVVLRGGRIQWDSAHLCKITGSTGRLVIAELPVQGASPLTVTPYASGTLRGIKWPSGTSYEPPADKGNIAASNSVNMSTILPYETSTYEITGVISITAVNTLNRFRVMYNPGGTQYVEFQLPNFKGIAYVTVEYNLLTGYAQARCTYLTKDGQQVLGGLDSQTITQTLSASKYVDIFNAGDSTMSLLDAHSKIIN